jgi:hypothetical protein
MAGVPFMVNYFRVNPPWVAMGLPSDRTRGVLEKIADDESN